jgi:uncharacterized protein YjgD (DUF1641 family)
MDGGVNADAEIRSYRDFLTDEDYEHLLNRNKKLYEPDTGHTDDETYKNLELGIRLGDITEHRQVDSFRDQLGREPYTHLLGLIDQKRREAKAGKKTDKDKTRDGLVKANKSFLGGVFQVAGVLDFDQEANTTTTYMVNEFEIRALTEPDKDPTALATEVMMKWAPMLQRKLRQRRPGGVGSVMRYMTEDEVNAAYTRKELTPQQANIQRRLVQYHDFLGDLGAGKRSPGTGAGAPASQQQQKTPQQKPKTPFPSSFGGGPRR